MRNKLRSLLLALALCTGAFFTPLYAEAKAEEDTTPPAVTAWLENGKINIEAKDEGTGIDALYINGRRISAGADKTAEALLTDYAGTQEKTVRMYAVDGAGNRSQTVEIDNPAYVPDGKGDGKEAGKPASASMDREQETVTAKNPMTPEGQAAVLDNATEEEGKEFYTFETQAGNVFYLVVDKQRDADNVYFLNAVTENDLQMLAEPVQEQTQESVIPEEPVCECSDRCKIGSINTSCKVCLTDLSACKGQESAAEEGEEERKQEKEKESGGGLFFILLAVLAAGGAGYYLKVYKPRNDFDGEEDMDDLPDDEEEVNEDAADEDARQEWQDEPDMAAYDDYPDEGGEDEGL